MKAEDRLKGMLQKESPCPICAGTGVDPVTRTVMEQDKPKVISSTCRCCLGQKKITRYQEETNHLGEVQEVAILFEEIGSHGGLRRHIKAISKIADKHREVLEASTGTNAKRLNDMKAADDVVLGKAYDTWKAENR